MTGAVLALALLAAPAPVPVAMPGRYFDPGRLTVTAGETVAWRNHDAEQHTIAGPGFMSPALATHGKFEHRFDVPGGYAYVCTLHPFMRGWVEVLPAAAPGEQPVVAAKLAAIRRGERIELTARVSPPQAGAVAALQLHFRDRFAWRQVDHRRFAGASARFTLRADMRRRARIVVYDRSGAPVATSRPLRPWTVR